MAWSIEFVRAAERELSRLDPEMSRRILRFLRERLAQRNDPRSLGEALKGSRFAGLWKYRVGSCRVIAQIDDRTVRILVVRVGNRREVYE